MESAINTEPSTYTGVVAMTDAKLKFIINLQKNVIDRKTEAFCKLFSYTVILYHKFFQKAIVFFKFFLYFGLCMKKKRKIRYYIKIRIVLLIEIWLFLSFEA